jgi:hypothetical protein
MTDKKYVHNPYSSKGNTFAKGFEQMERQNNTGGTSTRIPHAFTLKKRIGGGDGQLGQLIDVGLVVEDPTARFQPAYKVVKALPSGETQDTGLIIDLSKAGDMVLKKFNTEYNAESPVEGTYQYIILNRFWKHLSKADNVYFRCTTGKKEDPTREVYMMFPVDRADGAGATGATKRKGA